MDRRAVADALNLVDNRKARAEAAAMLAGLSPSAPLVGVTGPPGSGKSSLVAALIDAWRAAGRSVGVLAVDPSSARTGGALLGDRLRMMRSEPDDGVFIRSLASRGELGGLAPEVYPMATVLASAFDVVVVETVGIGQSEIDVADVVDTVCLVVQPASGDTVQFLKSGIMEVPDLFVVNKADLGVVAKRTARELEAAVGGRAPVLLVSATRRAGVEAVVAALAARPVNAEARAQRGQRWVEKRIREEFGTAGWRRVGAVASDAVSPFVLLERLRGELTR
jgi:LAO/AO transport system kinase